MEPGQIACVPAYEIMHNEAKYPHPNEFDGLRFLTDPSVVPGGNSKTGDGGGMRGTTFTEGSKDFPIWGYGSKIWYVVKAVILVVGHGEDREADSLVLLVLVDGTALWS